MDWDWFKATVTIAAAVQASLNVRGLSPDMQALKIAEANERAIAAAKDLKFRYYATPMERAESLTELRQRVSDGIKANKAKIRSDIEKIKQPNPIKANGKTEG